MSYLNNQFPNFPNPTEAETPRFQEFIDELESDFDEADVDKSGELDVEKLVKIFQDNGFTGNEKYLVDTFSRLDKDGNHNHKVTREEYMAALQDLPKLTTSEARLRRNFKELDREESGQLTYYQLLSALETGDCTDPLVPHGVVSKLFDHLSRQGKVDYEELLHVVGVESKAIILKQIFSELDTNHDSHIDKGQAENAIKDDHELFYQPGSILETLQAAPRTVDGEIDYIHFMETWLRREARYYKV